MAANILISDEFSSKPTPRRWPGLVRAYLILIMNLNSFRLHFLFQEISNLGSTATKYRAIEI